LPHAVPRVVPAISTTTADNTVYYRTRRIDSKREAALSVVVRIKDNLDFVGFGVIVAPDESGNNLTGFTVITHDSKIDRLIVVGDLEGGAFRDGFPFIGIALTEVFVEGRGLPDFVV
jgi:hypothetical protein